MRLGWRVLTAMFCLAFLAAPATGGDDGRRKLAVQGHGERIHATLHFYDWCPEDSEYCSSGVIDYVYEADPRRLPFHRGSVMRLRTAPDARRLTVTFSRPGRDKRIQASPSADGRSWTLRAPGRVYPKQEIGVVVDYRYRKDGRTYGGRYSFSLPVRKHRHRS